MRPYWMLATRFRILSVLIGVFLAVLTDTDHLVSFTLKYLPALRLQLTIPLTEFVTIKIDLQIVINPMLQAAFGS
jgi:hypothetical protein